MRLWLQVAAALLAGFVARSMWLSMPLDSVPRQADAMGGHTAREAKGDIATRDKLRGGTPPLVERGAQATASAGLSASGGDHGAASDEAAPGAGISRAPMPASSSDGDTQQPMPEPPSWYEMDDAALREWLEHVPPPPEKYYLVVCTMTRWDEDRIVEWVVRNYAEGVQHFYLYEDHGAESDLLEHMLAPLIEKSIVTVQNFIGPGAQQQHAAKNAMCMHDFGHTTTWMAVFDTDEFLTMQRTDVTLHEFLRSMEAHAGVCMAMVSACAVMRAQGHDAAAVGELRREPWLLTSQPSQLGYNDLHHPKSVFQVSRGFPGQAHYSIARTSAEAQCVNERGEAYSKWHNAFGVNVPLSYDTIAVVHYYARNSLSDMLRKRYRTTGRLSQANMGDYWKRLDQCVLEGRFDVASLRRAGVVAKMIAAYPVRFPEAGHHEMMERLRTADEGDECLAEARSKVVDGYEFDHAAYQQARDSRPADEFPRLDPLMHWLMVGCKSGMRGLWQRLDALPAAERSPSLLAPAVHWVPRLLERRPAFPALPLLELHRDLQFGLKSAVLEAWGRGEVVPGQKRHQCPGCACRRHDECVKPTDAGRELVDGLGVCELTVPPQLCCYIPHGAKTGPHGEQRDTPWVVDLRHGTLVQPSKFKPAREPHEDGLRAGAWTVSAIHPFPLVYPEEGPRFSQKFIRIGSGHNGVSGRADILGGKPWMTCFLGYPGDAFLDYQIAERVRIIDGHQVDTFWTKHGAKSKEKAARARTSTGKKRYPAA